MSLFLRWVSSSLGPAAPFPVTCIDPSFRDLDKKLVSLPPVCSFPGFGLPSGSAAGNVVMHRFLSCKVVEELMKMYVVLFWETSGLWFSQCHSSVMCYAVATSWKFSETPCIDSS